MEAILLNPSILLVDLIVAGVCVAVVFFTKFNILGATLDTVDKFGKKGMTFLGEQLYEGLGLNSVYKSLGGQGDKTFGQIQQEFGELKKQGDTGAVVVSTGFKEAAALVPGVSLIVGWLQGWD